jgi:hypothetical protein
MLSDRIRRVAQEVDPSKTRPSAIEELKELHQRLFKLDGDIIRAYEYSVPYEDLKKMEEVSSHLIQAHKVMGEAIDNLVPD